MTLYFCALALALLATPAKAGVIVTQNTSPGATSWPGVPLISTVTNPASASVGESFNGAGGNTNLSQTFTVVSADCLLQTIDLYAGGGTGSNLTLNLYDLGPQTAPNPSPYTAAISGGNLFGSGAGLPISYNGQANGILKFDFTGPDQVLLQSGHMYAFELTGTSNTTVMFWQRVTSDTYPGGAAYRNRSWINTNSARDFALAVYASTASYTIPIHSGYNLIANQLDHGSNTLNEVLGHLGTNGPDGLVLSKYNNASGTWSVSAYSAASGLWDNGNSITLSPGDGAFLQSPANFYYVMVGRPHVPILPVNMAAGATHLLSRQTNDIGTFTNIVGFPATNGATVYKWNGSNYITFSFASGAWSPSVPTVAVGEAIWASVFGSNSSAPLLTACPSNKTVVCGTPWTYDPPVVAGFCSGSNVTVSVLSTASSLVNACELVNTRTWLIRDACGHSNTCSQVVTIVNAPPTLFCPAVVTAYTCSNSAPVFFTVTGTNACTVSAPNTCATCPKVLVSCFPPSGSLFGLGTNTVTCFATDLCGVVNTCTFQVVVLPGAGCCQPPAITMQPQLVVTTTNGAAVFNATATGSPTLIYQWRKDGADLADGGNISGAQTPTLTVTSPMTNQAGGYFVVVTNTCGSCTSLVAQVVLADDYLPDGALGARAKNFVIAGNNATFTFTASNEGALPLQNLTFTGTFTGTPATFIEASPGCLITPLGNDFTLNCPLPLLPVGTSVVYRVTFRVDAPGVLAFSGSVSAADGELILANNSASASTSFGYPPAIIADPFGFNSTPGGIGSLNVSATGTAPLYYHWRLDNVPVGLAGDTLYFTDLHSSDEGSYVGIASNSWGTAASAPAVVTLTFPGAVTAGIDGMQVLQIVGKTATTDMEIRLKAGDPTRLVVEDKGGAGVVGEFNINTFNKLVINLGDADNKLVFNDDNGMVAALDKHFEIYGGTGSNLVVASSQGIDLTAIPGLLTALAAAPDFEKLTADFHNQGYTNLMLPAIDMIGRLYTNLVLASQMLRDNANTNLLVAASNRVAQAKLLGNLASSYANEAAWRFSGAGYSSEQFTNCLFGLIAQLEAIEDNEVPNTVETNDDPDPENPDSLTVRMDTISDQLDELADSYEAGADQYATALEASGDDFYARVQQNVQVPGDQLGNADGPAFESLANAFTNLASQLLEVPAAQAELDADVFSAKAVDYEKAADDLVAQARALNQTLESFTAAADPFLADKESIPTGTNAGCDKDIDASNKFVINIGGLIIGTPFNDKIIAKPKTLLILGLGGDDLIIGSDKFNIIHGGSGDDEIHGQGGTDLLFGGPGNDCMFGDEGFDLLYGGDGNDNLHGGTNMDLIIGGNGDDTMFGDENFDVMIGGEGDDTMDGGDGINVMFGGPGMDTMTSGDGYLLSMPTNGVFSFLCDLRLGSLMFGGATNDTMYGGEGIDVMFGGDGNDTMYSSNNIDVVFGNAGDDKIYGDDGGPLFHVDISGTDTGIRLGNVIFGGTGDDEITGGRDLDLLFGGDGNDTIKGSYDYPWWKIVKLSFDCGEVDIGLDADIIFGGKGDDVLDGGYGIDFIFGGPGDDIIMGNSAPFELPLSMGFLFGGPGDDHIYGGKWDVITLAFGNDGVDHIYGSTFGVMNLLFGNDGDDFIEGKGDLLNLLFGGPGNDTMTGGALVLDLMFGGPNNDIMHGGPFGALDVMFGGDGDDIMIGDGSLVEVQFGNAGNDRMNSGPGLLYAMWGNDGCDTMVGDAVLGIMFGNDNADNMTGGFGMDIMFGGPGPDIMDGGDGPDIMFGGAGDDTMSGGTDAWPNLMFGNADNDTIYGGNGPDILLGNGGDDHIYGGGGPDIIFGGPGHDAIDGGDGSDLIFGGSGNDCLFGGVGNDLIFGGSDNDFINGDEDGDLIFGNSGNDTIRGNGGGNYLFGNKDDDTIKSEGDTDRVWGNRGNDNIQNFGDHARLRGNRGDDIFDLQGGTDIRVFGGSGTDLYELNGGIPSKVKSASIPPGGGNIGVVPNPSCAQVHGVAWLDLNQNGIRDPGEPGITGVRVNFDNGEIYTVSQADNLETCTNETGTYGLTDLPGDGLPHTVRGHVAGYHQIYPVPTSTVTLFRIDIVNNWDLGFAPGGEAISIAAVSLDTQGGIPHLVFRGSGGAPDSPFYVLSSTNMATPRSNWTLVGTHLFDGSGNFSVTNTIPPGEPARFFLLNVP
jgi:Ca2+-binding RTX toxin-like protein